eukprot:3327690-Pleurochrysis_carterae.AAC.1
MASARSASASAAVRLAHGRSTASSRSNRSAAAVGSGRAQDTDFTRCGGATATVAVVSASRLWA